MRGPSEFPDAGIKHQSGADAKISQVFIEPNNRGLVMDGSSNGININELSVINGGPFQYGVVSGGTGFARIITNSIFENALEQQLIVGGGSSRFTLSYSWVGAGDAKGTMRVGVQIEPGASEVTIANNRIGDQRLQGIMSRVDYVTITGNRLTGNVNSGAAADSLQVEGGDHVTISNNQVSAGTDRYGVGLYDHGSTPLNNYIYEGNDTSGTGRGYANTATGTSLVVANNLNGSGSTTHQTPLTTSAAESKGSVTVDGKVSSGEWDNAARIVVSPNSPDLLRSGTVWGKESNEAGLTSTYSIKLDSKNLYLLEQRQDDVLNFTESGAQMYLSDATMVFLDLNNNKSGSNYTDGTYAISVSPSGPDSKPHAWIREGHNAGAVEKTLDAATVKGTFGDMRYTMNVAIPWSGLQVTRFTAKVGAQVGFTVMATNNDGPGNWGQIM